MGHVWASRTGVYDDLESQIRVILEDDGFRVVKNPTSEQLHPGDLAAYWHARMFLHVGLIVEIREASGFAAKVPWVLSKWDDTTGEVVHAYQDVEFGGLDFTTEFWTERQIEEPRRNG